MLCKVRCDLPNVERYASSTMVRLFFLQIRRVYVPTCMHICIKSGCSGTHIIAGYSRCFVFGGRYLKQIGFPNWSRRQPPTALIRNDRLSNHPLLSTAPLWHSFDVDCRGTPTLIRLLLGFLSPTSRRHDQRSRRVASARVSRSATSRLKQMEWRQPRWNCRLELYLQSASAAFISEASIAVVGSKRVPEGPRVVGVNACGGELYKLDVTPPRLHRASRAAENNMNTCKLSVLKLGAAVGNDGHAATAVVVPQREPGMSGVDGSSWQGTWIQKQLKCGCLLPYTIGAMGWSQQSSIPLRRVIHLPRQFHKSTYV